MSGRFRLEPILRLRSHELDRKRVTLAAAIAECGSWQRQREEAAQLATDAAGSLASKLRDGIDAGGLSLRMDAIDAVRAQAEAASRELQAAQQALAAAREAVVAARGKLRALEILRERREAEREAQEQRREQQLLDELGLARRQHGAHS